MSNFKPLSLDLIDEGRFVGDINTELQTAIKHLIDYKKRHGKDASVGAKAKVAVNVTVCFDGDDANDFSVKGDIKLTVPARPAVVSKALEDSEQDGTATLFVRASGATGDDPRQQRLCTKDGRTVDPATGEVIDAKE